MTVQHWYKIVWLDKGGELSSARLFLCLESLLPCVRAARFVIRNPEVHNNVDQRSSTQYYDGRVLDAHQAVDLVGVILNGEGFWCRLESDEMIIHVGEDVVYVGTEFGRMIESDSEHCKGFLVQPIANSPYSIDRNASHPYRIVDKNFWIRIEREVEISGSVILLCQWAGGRGGEQWHYLSSQSHVSETVNSLVPRSIIAVFTPSHYRKTNDRGISLPENALGSDPVYGNLRVLERLPGQSRLISTTVSDLSELQERWKTLPAGSILLTWPEDDDHGLFFGVCADSDGVVRVSATFE